MEYTTGCDVEVIALVPGTNDLIDRDPQNMHKHITENLIPAEELTHGTKKEPELMKIVIDHEDFWIKISADNVMYEFAYKKPFKSVEEAVRTYSNSVEVLKEHLSVRAEIRFVDHFYINDDILNMSREAKVMGCEPDNNAYTLKKNPRPNVNKMRLLRTAGFHTHMGIPGFRKLSKEKKLSLAAHYSRAYDLSHVIGDVVNGNVGLREQHYGVNGAFRVCPAYGFEFRQRGSSFGEDLVDVETNFQNLENTVKIVKSGILADPTSKLCEIIHKAISERDASLAQEIMHKHIAVFSM